ncbi:MAG: hypothetical protein OEV00_02510 [Acidobacteriota bacterium]|nr:hypothetical protein [Acidobacteriota bacterium]MDH3784182.1 hypothetical protein [Acidobacteriota bacterium]
MSKLSTLTTFLDRLDEADLHYTLSSVREGALLVAVTAPEERWEIEFQSDGDVEIELFKSNGEIHDHSMIDDLFKRHGGKQR